MLYVRKKFVPAKPLSAQPNGICIKPPCSAAANLHRWCGIITQSVDIGGHSKDSGCSWWAGKYLVASSLYRYSDSSYRLVFSSARLLLSRRFMLAMGKLKLFFRSINSAPGFMIERLVLQCKFAPYFYFYIFKFATNFFFFKLW